MPDATLANRRKRPQVLVVEDDAALRNLMAIALRHDGIVVATANDGDEAIAQLNHGTVRVVLLDLMMPRVNGWEVIRWLKDHPESRPHSLIVVTAADRGLFNELDPSMVNAIIVKPFDIYELSGYVQRCCHLEHDRRRKRIVGYA